MSGTTLHEKLEAISSIQEGLVQNKVAKLCYTDYAYEHNLVNGVTDFEASREYNIPTSAPTILKVNDTILTKGFRATASSVTRMLLNHFLGRLSYNLNKVNDNVNNLLATLEDSLGEADGLATLDTTGRLVREQLPETVSGATYIVNSDDSLAYWLSGGEDGVSSGGDDFRLVLIKRGVWAYAGSTANVSSEVIQGETGSELVFTNGTATLTNNLSESPNAKIDNVVIKHESSIAIRNFAQVTNCKIYNRSNFWVAFISNKGVCWSENGKDWSPSNITSGDTTSAYATYANGLWVLATTNRGLKWSEDGKTWNPSNISTGAFNSSTIYAVSNNPSIPSQWVACGYQGIYRSTDGKQWTKIIVTAPASDFTKVVFANGLFVALSAGAKGIYYSDDASLWRLADNTSGKYISDIAFANGQWFAVGYGDSDASLSGLWHSANGVNWVRDYSSVIKYTDLDNIKFFSDVWSVYGSINGGATTYTFVADSTPYDWISKSGYGWAQANGVVVAGDFHHSYYPLKWGLPADHFRLLVNSNTSSGSVSCIYYANGMWIVSINNSVYWSEDGKQWTEITELSGFSISNITSKTATMEYCRNVRNNVFAITNENNSSNNWLGNGQHSPGETAEGGFNQTTTNKA